MCALSALCHKTQRQDKRIVTINNWRQLMSLSVLYQLMVRLSMNVNENNVRRTRTLAD